MKLQIYSLIVQTDSVSESLFMQLQVINLFF